MLHARIEVAQILDMFQIRAVISEFSPGQDPEITVSQPVTYDLAEIDPDADALSTVIALIRLWSEMTNPQ